MLLEGADALDIALARAEGDIDDEDAAEEEAVLAMRHNFVDDCSWRDVREDAEGRLIAIDNLEERRAKRQRRQLSADAVGQVKKGMIRYLYLVIDLSQSVLEVDLRPSRLSLMVQLVEEFIVAFFDQNPLSNIGIIVTRESKAEKLTELSGNPKAQIAALKANLRTGGDASLQNSLDAAREALAGVPSYGHREVLILLSALTTTDPGDIYKSARACKRLRVRCSTVGVAAEVYVCKAIAELTKGTYGVALDEHHLGQLLMEHIPPPPTTASNSEKASLICMGFPRRQAREGSLLSGRYVCPRCRAHNEELPTTCKICKLTLGSSPHLARSYHHLFALPPLTEIHPTKLPKDQKRALASHCFACGAPFTADVGQGVRLECPTCRKQFCFDCDTYMHEEVHNCPGCLFGQFQLRSTDTV